MAGSPSPTRVALVARPGSAYAWVAPFDPPHPVYAMVEAVFAALGLDAARRGTPEWNPLGDVIAPGDRVIVKPTLATTRRGVDALSPEQLARGSTHGSVLRPILDYALRAAGPRGSVTIAAAPAGACDFEATTNALGYGALRAWYAGRGQTVNLLDLRSWKTAPRMLLDDVQRSGRSLTFGLVVRETLAGDPRGYSVVDLRERSRFADVARRGSRLRAEPLHPNAPVPHHTEGRHEYSVANTLLAADVVLDVAKLLTHAQAGVALSLASAIGFANEKDWLPRFTAGSPDEDGDEYPFAPPLAVQLEKRLSRVPLPFSHALVARAAKIGGGGDRDAVSDGRWDGNDTVWRTLLDLNQIVFFADRDGLMRDAPQRRYLAIVDGVIGGEGEGGTPRPAGLVVGGLDPALVDLVATQAMGFSEENLPVVARALAHRGAPLLPSSDRDRLDLVIDGEEPQAMFAPPKTWGALLRRPRGIGGKIV